MHNCKNCGGCGNSVNAEVVNKITKKTDKEKLWDSFLLFMMPVIIIVVLAFVFSLALKIFFWTLPVLLLVYIGMFVYRKFIK